MSPSKNNQQQQIEKLYKENNKLIDKIKHLEIENNGLNKKLQQIEIENNKLNLRIGDGEYNELNTKILNIKDNPLKLAMERKQNGDKNKIIELEGKLNELNNKIKRIKINNNKEIKNNNNNNNNNDHDMRYYELENKYNILNKKLILKQEQIDCINKELGSSKKINQRMKSLFGAKAGEYRERIYQMTGYNICLLGDGKHYRLQHLWMNHENDEIILQIDKLNQLQIKDTPFLRNINKSLLNKLKKTRSLPIFLSQLTLDLYKDDIS